MSQHLLKYAQNHGHMCQVSLNIQICHGIKFQLKHVLEEKFVKHQ